MSALISTHIKGERLQKYAATLIDAGFSIRVPKPALTIDGKPVPVTWFVYEREGNTGTVQRELLDSYSHAMPVPPTKEDGSSIHMFKGPELHLVHAEKTARPENLAKYNRNRLFKNAGLGRYERNYVVVEKDPPRVVPVRVVWQEITQYETVVEVPMERGMDKGKLKEVLNEKLDDLTDEDLQGALDTEWNGPLRRFETMEPVWDAVEPAKEA